MRDRNSFPGSSLQGRFEIWKQAFTGILGGNRVIQVNFFLESVHCIGKLENKDPPIFFTYIFFMGGGGEAIIVQ